MASEEIIGKLKERMAPEKLQNMTASFQFNLTGEESCNFYIKLEEGQGEPVEGTMENPDLTVTIDAEDFKNLLDGRLNPMAAFMSGKIKIEGDMTLAMKLQKLLG